MPTQRETEQALKGTEPPIQNAFLTAVQTTIAATTLQAVLDSLDDFTTLVDEVGLNRPALNDTLEAVRNAYKKGGSVEAPQAKINFDIRNERAEQWLREHSSQFVTRVEDDQREAIRAIVETGTRLGRNPRQTALDIVGRTDATGKRKGGVVGLTGPQARYVANAREQLRSGDPAQMRQYLTRSRRDRRFDGIVKRAIAAGKPVSAKDTERLVGRYSERLLKLRGETVARTEAITAFNQARHETYRQAIDQGKVDADNVTKTWRASGDSRVRHTHRVLSHNTVGVHGLFHSPSGAMLSFPGDFSHGAPPSEVVNCRCLCLYKIDHFAEANRAV